ncbi:TPA: hypothetical protein P2Q98_004620 [Aeromonas veronii]|uniref:hypothetical protein n=1 Tax=Aeromonas veronii TaxID=654 RepID=UPI00330826FA|nr:hypothetical protein [Aeromonas veronii]HDO1336340.1 hypothetical protein [Aeromonas veronii]HDO1340830.1 hypothetical protein [Aeromonas veronii]HDO1345394.1 hypothetical protein [Aeromonas veronii]HDO1349964.1 hypothetical protein [Aeromonas veronii]
MPNHQSKTNIDCSLSYFDDLKEKEQKKGHYWGAAKKSKVVTMGSGNARSSSLTGGLMSPLIAGLGGQRLTVQNCSIGLHIPLSPDTP